MKLISSKAARLLPILIAFFALRANAQTLADSAVNNIASKLSVNKEKARQIYAATTYNRAEIDRLMKDDKRKPGDKQRQLQRLVAQRRHQIDSVLTPDQKKTLLSGNEDFKQKEEAHRQEVMKKHEAEMNRIPHTRTLKPIQTDTTRKKAKTN